MHDERFEPFLDEGLITRVVRPIKSGKEDAILMTYIGDEDDAAPQLRVYRPKRDEAEGLFRRLIRNVEMMLGANVIHADLSPYNILVWNGLVTVIDLPQAVDPRKNCHAAELLRRDV